MKRWRRLFEASWVGVGLLALLIPQLALANTPRGLSLGSPAPQPVEQVLPPAKATTTQASAKDVAHWYSEGMLLAPALSLDLTEGSGVRVAQGPVMTLEMIEAEIHRLKRVRNRRYGLVGPIVMTAIGGPLMLAGGILLISGFAAFYYSMEMMILFSLISGALLVPGIILFAIGLSRLIRNSKGWGRMNRRINRLKEQREMLRGGGRPTPPGPPGPPGGAEGSFVVPLLSLSF